MMNLMQEVKNGLRSLFLHRLRSLLSTLGILFGIAAVITMLSIGEGARQETIEQIQQLGMNNILIRQPPTTQERLEGDKSFTQPLNLLDAQALEDQIPSLLSISPLRIVEETVSGASFEQSPEILAVTRSFADMKGIQLAEGRFLTDWDRQKQKRVCVLGYAIAKDLGRKGHPGQSLIFGDKEYEVVGVLKSVTWKGGKNLSITHRNLDRAIFIPLETHDVVNPLFPSNHRLSEIDLQIAPSASLSEHVRLVGRILDRLHRGEGNYQIIVPQELIEQAGKTQRTFNFVLGGISAISLLVGGIGIMNIMLANVSERKREIGIRRALGASQRRILIQFLVETFLLTSLGALLGIAAGFILSATIGAIAGWRTIVTPWSVLMACLMSTGVGLCSGLYPAYQAAHLDPVRALRQD